MGIAVFALLVVFAMPTGDYIRMDIGSGFRYFQLSGDSTDLLLLSSVPLDGADLIVDIVSTSCNVSAYANIGIAPAAKSNDTEVELSEAPKEKWCVRRGEVVETSIDDNHSGLVWFIIDGNGVSQNMSVSLSYKYPGDSYHHLIFLSSGAVFSLGALSFGMFWCVIYFSRKRIKEEILDQLPSGTQESSELQVLIATSDETAETE